jgi:hypothetical protein
MSGRLLKCLFTAFVIQMALPNESTACTCLGPRVNDRAAYQEWFQQRTVVFRGTVIADESFERRYTGARTTFHMRKVTFRIDRQWKGVEGSTITVITNAEASMCGVDFRQGSQHLVAADRQLVSIADLTPSEIVELVAGSCTSSWLTDQKAFLDAFGEGQPSNPGR